MEDASLEASSSVIQKEQHTIIPRAAIGKCLAILSLLENDPQGRQSWQAGSFPFWMFKPYFNISLNIVEFDAVSY